jgi:hypothetical protein
MSNATDDFERRVVERMARAMCIAQGYDPDEVYGVAENWSAYYERALMQYRAWIAMQAVLLSLPDNDENRAVAIATNTNP